MFMRFRGGGIGHKVTREWDEFLQREGRELPPDDEDVEPSNLQSEGSESDDEIEQDGQDDKPRASGTGSESASDSNGSEDESEDEEEDVLIADEGEELDEDIWAQEGYDAL